MKAPYPKYKATSIPWLPEIPEHWKIRRAKYVFRVIDEKNAKGDEELLSVSEHHGVLPRRNANVNTFKAESYEGYKLCKKGDLVINSLWAWSRGLGVSEYEGIISNAYSVFRLKVPANHRFLHYLLRTEGYVAEYLKRSKGIWISRLQLSDFQFLDLPLPLPPLTEQAAIANYLDVKTEQINRFIEKKQKLIALLKEQKQAVINRVVIKGVEPSVPMKDSGVEWLGEIPFHWKVIKLKYIANAIIGVTYSPTDIVDERSGILVLRSSNIQNGKLSYSDNVYIKKDIPRKLFTKKGDILLCARNGSADLIGKNVCIDENSEGSTFGAFMTIVRSKYWRYLYWFFNSSIFKSQTGLFATSTINQLTSDTLNNLKIAFPIDVRERDEVIKNLGKETQKIDLGIEKIEKEIEIVKELKQSLIAEVVTGKIKVV